ncbi:MAG: hypothetical protein OEY16_01545 [Alphaproteobacteria bacterium]|nr:hypothetical protein [Alphaproteobacteria bacterium]
MSVNAVIDVTIGLILMYLLLSLICTIINEFIGTFMGWRAANLARSIEQLIDDETLRGAIKATGVMGSFDKVSGKRGPSYIPSRAFALGVVRALNGNQPGTMDTLRGAVGNLPDSVIRNVLEDLADEAGGDIDIYRRNLADWFDDVMERASGGFKRKMKICSFVVAMAVVLAVNGDSVQVAKSLWEDAALRSQIAEAASELVQDTGLVDDLADIKVISAELRPLPIGWDFDSPDWSSDWYRSPGGWVVKLFGLLFTAMAVTLGAPFWFDLLSKFIKFRGAGAVPKTRREREQERQPATV